MTSGGFAAGDWIDRLAGALPGLAEAQERYLSRYREMRLLSHLAPGVHANGAPEFPLGDLHELYARARHSHLLGEREHYAALCAVLDPVRHILIAHPTLARVVGPLVGRDNFYMEILNAGGSTSPTDLIAGLMARAAELPGDRFRKAVRELHAFLSPVREEASAALADGLDAGYDAVLFHGLTVKGRIEVGDGMALLPFEQVRAFVDEELVYELAPPGAGFHGYRSVGALARTYRWRPAFCRAGYERELASHNPLPFLRQAQIFLELLAVAHATPVLGLADLSHRIDQSAGRLLGLERHDGGCRRGRSAQAFDGFEAAPELGREAVVEAREAFANRTGERFGAMAPVVGRLSEALARDGRFAVGDRILDVAIALERMYVLDEGKIGHKLRSRASRFLETDESSRESIGESVRELYDVRSDIVHNRLDRLSPERNHSAFRRGFDVARRSVFRLIREGRPEDWSAVGGVGS